MGLGLLIAPLIAVNIWHAIAIYLSTNYKRPHWSISQSALASPATLNTHRAVHVLGALSLGAFAVLMWKDAGVWPAILLLLGAVFDVLQVLTLNEKTKHREVDIHDPHQLTAWPMAGFYLAFSIIYGAMRLNWIIIAIYLSLLVGAYIIYVRLKPTLFWPNQMLFFISVSVILLLAYTNCI